MCYAHIYPDWYIIRASPQLFSHSGFRLVKYLTFLREVDRTYIAYKSQRQHIKENPLHNINDSFYYHICGLFRSKTHCPVNFQNKRKKSNLDLFNLLFTHLRTMYRYFLLISHKFSFNPFISSNNRGRSGLVTVDNSDISNNFYPQRNNGVFFLFYFYNFTEMYSKNSYLSDW